MLIVLLICNFICTSCSNDNGLHETELEQAYQAYVDARKAAFLDFNADRLADTVTSDYLHVLEQHISTREQAGNRIQEEIQVREFKILFYGETVATVQVTQEYLYIPPNESVDHYSESYWQSETKKCEFTRSWKIVDGIVENGNWLPNYCELVASDL